MGFYYIPRALARGALNTSMTKEETILLNRFKDLAKKSYQKNIYTSTAFLTIAEAEIFYLAKNEFSFIKWEFLGGYETAERKILRFGSEEEFGYEEELPICVITIEPLMKKFADDLSHRDFLGALLNLGIERSTLGDIVINEKSAAVFCLNTVADFICDELTRVKHTSVMCKKVNLDEYESMAPEAEFIEINESVASERADLIMSKVTKLSRSAIIELFRNKYVTVNGRIFENNSNTLKAGDAFTIRGYGKFIYDGCNYVSKKGKLNITVRKYK